MHFYVEERRDDVSLQCYMENLLFIFIAKCFPSNYTTIEGIKRDKGERCRYKYETIISGKLLAEIVMNRNMRSELFSFQ